MVLAKSRYEDQWNRLENLNINPHSYAHIIFDKDAKTVEKKTACLTNVAGKTGYPLNEN
jgi:hypothetical protein